MDIKKSKSYKTFKEYWEFQMELEVFTIGQMQAESIRYSKSLQQQTQTKMEKFRNQKHFFKSL